MTITHEKDDYFKGCSSGPCPPAPPPADTDPYTSDDWKYWLDGECSPCYAPGCGLPSTVDPTYKLPQAEKYECAGPNEVLYTMYADTDCANESSFVDFFKSQGGLTTDQTFPLRKSTNSWTEYGVMHTGTGTGHIGGRLGGLRGCSDQVNPLPLAPSPAPASSSARRSHRAATVLVHSGKRLDV